MKRAREVGDGPACASTKPAVEAEFLVPFPDSFFTFCDFLLEVAPDSPCDALLEAGGVKFTGPCEAVFEHLGKRVRPAPAGDSAPPRVAASRFFYDPPEVCAFAAFPSAAVRHWAYFRDSPGCEPGAVVESDDHRGSTFTFVGDNIFAAAVGLLEAAEAGSGGTGKASATSGGATATAAPGTAARGSLTSWLGATSSGGAGAGADAGAGVGTGAGAGAGSRSRASLLARLKEVAAVHHVDTATPGTFAKDRPRKKIGSTLSGLGLVVPYDSKTTVGYRPLPLDKKKLRDLLRVIAKGDANATQKHAFQEMQTFAHIANDECDFGMGLELGLDLWSYAPALTEHAKEHLSIAYTLLNRPAFGTLLELHATHRNACMSPPFPQAPSGPHDTSTSFQRRYFGAKAGTGHGGAGKGRAKGT